MPGRRFLLRGRQGALPARRPSIAMPIAYLLLLCAAFGTGGLWPVYISQLGGGPAAAGIFNAVGSLTGIGGTLCSGWLTDRLGRRKQLFCGSCIFFAGTWWLMARAATWQQLTLINAFGGFAFGAALNMIIILTGLLAGEMQRGRSFGLLTFMSGLSLLLSGLAFGPIADRYGFPALFVVDALLCLACVVPGLFFVEPPAPPDTEPAAPPGMEPAAPRRSPRQARGRVGLGRGFYLLAAAAFFASMAGFGSSLGRSIAMSQLGFSATAISLATAIGGASSMPAPLAAGWLSDRMGRKRLLLACLGSGSAAVLVLAFAGSAWGFWGASALLALLMSAPPLLQALATDLLPARSVGIGLSLLSGASSAGLFTGSLGIGVAIQQMGARPSFLTAALAPLIALALLLPIREPGRRGPADLPGDRVRGSPG
jgi:MFS family permease